MFLNIKQCLKAKLIDWMFDFPAKPNNSLDPKADNTKEADKRICWMIIWRCGQWWCSEVHHGWIKIVVDFGELVVRWMTNPSSTLQTPRFSWDLMNYKFENEKRNILLCAYFLRVKTKHVTKTHLAVSKKPMTNFSRLPKRPPIPIFKTSYKFWNTYKRILHRLTIILFLSSQSLPFSQPWCPIREANWQKYLR